MQLFDRRVGALLDQLRQLVEIDLITVAPPRGRGAVSPVSRRRCFTRRAQDELT